MLKTLRNLALLGLMLGFGAQPAHADTCGECSGDCTVNGDDLGCGGSMSYCVGECFSYICEDPRDGMGTIC